MFFRLSGFVRLVSYKKNNFYFKQYEHKGILDLMAPKELDYRYIQLVSDNKKKGRAPQLDLLNETLKIIVEDNLKKSCS